MLDMKNRVSCAVLLLLFITYTTSTYIDRYIHTLYCTVKYTNSEFSFTLIETGTTPFSYPIANTHISMVSFGNYTEQEIFIQLLDMKSNYNCTQSNMTYWMLGIVDSGLAKHGTDHMNGRQLAEGLVKYYNIWDDVDIYSISLSLDQIDQTGWSNCFFLQTIDRQNDALEFLRYQQYGVSNKSAERVSVYSTTHLLTLHSEAIALLGRLPPFIEDKMDSLETVLITRDDRSLVAATGEFFYIEEHQDLIRTTIPSTITGLPSTRKWWSSLPSDVRLSRRSGVVEFSREEFQCFLPSREGILEFTDFGPDPTAPFRNPYIHSRAHGDVMGIARFAYLDSLGARLVGGKLQVFLPGDSGIEGFGSFSMYYESSSFGLGLGDSTSLSPPISVHSVLSQDAEFEFLQGIYSGTCFCDNLLGGKVHYVVGITNYPQYGHTLFNCLSNILATVWSKGLRPADVALHINLERNTTGGVSGVEATHYSLHWQDTFQEVFGAVGFAAVYSWDNTILWSRQSNETVCFERIMLGSMPLLDHLNKSSPMSLWTRFASHISDSIVPLSRKRSFLSPISSDRGLATPITVDRCAVTFIVRSSEMGYTSRAITNVLELRDVANSYGCTTQIVAMSRWNISEQVAQLRFNTTLLVGADGTGLLNAVWMHKCSTVFRVSMWRKPGIVSKLSPGNWVEYQATFNETTWLNEDSRQSIVDWLRELRQRHGDALNDINLGDGPFPNVLVEDYLREGQICSVNPITFSKIVIDSEVYRKNCMRAMYGNRFHSHIV